MGAIPTSTSHGKSIDNALNEFNSILLNCYNRSVADRTLMAAGVVSDLVIKNIWDIFSSAEDRVTDIRRLADFHDAYARYRGLSYFFNCTDDINAATDLINGLPANHKFITNHRVDFKIVQGSLTGGLSEGTNYFVRTVDAANGTITLTTTEDGASDINLTNATGTAEMILNIKPDLASVLTAFDDILTEIETSLTIRGSTYDRVNLEHDYSTRSTVETATLRTELSTFEALIDVTTV